MAETRDWVNSWLLTDLLWLRESHSVCFKSPFVSKREILLDFLQHWKCNTIYLRDFLEYYDASYPLSPHL